MRTRLPICTLLLLFLLPLGAAAQTRVPNLPIQTLVVLPFENTSKAPGLEWISESFPEVLGSRLGQPRLYVVPRADREYAFDRAGVPASVRLSRATLYRIVEQMDADYAVLGSYTFDGQSFTARAELLDVKRLRLSPAQVESGPLPQLIDIQTALAWDLLRLIQPGDLPTRQRFLADAHPIRLDAFENYVRGVMATSPPLKIKHFRQAVRLNPNYTLAILQLARAYFDQRDYEQAASWFSQVPRTDPEGREAAFFLGLSAYYLGDFARAQEAFSFVASRLPLTEVYNNLGVVAGRRGQPAEIDYFQKAVGADPSDPDYHFNLAVALYKSGDSSGAARQLRQALNLRPGDGEAKSLLDSIAAQAATPAALREFNRAPVKPPLERLKRQYNETSYQQLALEIQNATERRLARTDPHTHAEFHVSRGRQYLDQGFKAEAEKDFREAIQLDSGSAGAHLGLARALEDSDPATALVEAQIALRLHPISTEALLLLARLDLKSNQRRAAQEYVDRALALEPNNAGALELKRALAK